MSEKWLFCITEKIVKDTSSFISALFVFQVKSIKFYAISIILIACGCAYSISEILLFPLHQLLDFRDIVCTKGSHNIQLHIHLRKTIQTY